MERESSVKISATVYKQLEEQSKSVAYTDNGTYNVSPDPGYWLSNVNVEVHVDQNLSVISELSAVISGLNDQIATITSLTINENGTYTPPEGVLGYNYINVNVVGGGEDFTAISTLSLNFTNNEPLPGQYYSLFNNVVELSIKGNVNSIAFKPGNLTSISDLGWSFSCPNLTSLTFPEGSLTQVGKMSYAFKLPKLTSIVFPDGSLQNVTTMSYAFSACSGLTYVIFPENSLQNVLYADDCFRACSKLKSMSFPENSLSKVIQAADFFNHCNDLTSVIFPKNSFTSVSLINNMFGSCFDLLSVSFPDGALTQVKGCQSLFVLCYALTSILLPQGALTQVTNMMSAFHQCSALQNLTIYNLPNINLTNIGFSTCTSLTLQSLQNILNALPVTTSSYKCTLGTTNLSKLSEEQIAIATNKGWTLN